MGEKRKSRITNNERKSKKEKKTINSVAPSTSNDDIEEQSSMHSNISNSDSSSQQPSTTQENNIPEEIEESQTIPPIDVETITNENPTELNPSTNDDNHKIPLESTTKSWWSSLIRLFHFGNNTTETKVQIDNSTDQQSPIFTNDSYLSNIKCRRSLHGGDSFVG